MDYGGSLVEEQIAYITKCVLVGLETMHANRLVHRNVKADHIFITDDGSIKLGINQNCTA